MKSASVAILLIISFAIFVNANEDNDNWPCYLKKCSKNNPDLSTCLVNHANLALDSIFAGDNKIGIPSFLPLRSRNLSFGKNKTFKIEMYDVIFFGVPKLHVVNMDWNFDKKTIDMHLIFHTAITFDAMFKSSGTFKGQNLTGYGPSNFVFVGDSQGVKNSYSMKYDTIKVLGKDYVQIKETQCGYEGGLRIEFQNQLLSKKEGEAHKKFLNEHSAEFFDAIRPEVNDLICITYNKVLNPIFFNFPLDLIFDSS